MLFAFNLRLDWVAKPVSECCQNLVMRQPDQKVADQAIIVIGVQIWL